MQQLVQAAIDAGSKDHFTAMLAKFSHGLDAGASGGTCLLCMSRV